jgi:putative transposase
MARANRYLPAGRPYHVVNRGNDRRAIFLEAADYRAFKRLLVSGADRFAIDLHGHCLMPNHFHLVAEPREDAQLSAYMQWVTGCYSCQFRTRTRTLGYGHVFQRRFWSAPIQSDLHFLTVLRYVEANPLRAGLVSRAEEWPWSSLRARVRGRRHGPRSESIPEDWCGLVNLVQRVEVLDHLRREISPRRGGKAGRPGVRER